MQTTLRNLFTTAMAAALVASVVSLPAFAGKPKWAEKSDQSIVEFAIAASGVPNVLDEDGEDFDILVAALLATGTVSIFNGTDYTVFAPNDQAFYDLTGTDNDTEALNAVISLIGVDGVAAVLAYHVTEGVRNSRSVTRAKQITMADGDTVSGRSGMIEANFSTAAILNADNRLSDGMVHIIDTVLLPINPL
jgi:uncharacterized surface protein with fasciclin (FAS1) repeats